MSEPVRKHLGELVNRDLFDFPTLCANPEGNFAFARGRGALYERERRREEVARLETYYTLGMLTIASEVNIDMLEALGPSTQDAILDVRAATSEQLLTELAVKYLRLAK